MKNTSARLLAVSFASVMLFAACSSSTGTDVVATEDDNTTITTQPSDPNQGADAAGGKPTVAAPDSETPTELRVIDLSEGPGQEAVDGSTVEVHYVGVLHKDGSEFDSSWDRGQTFAFTIGAGQVIKGWDEGVVGMKVGGQRQLDIPAELAYGDSGAGQIGPGEALTFVIDLVSVTS